MRLALHACCGPCLLEPLDALAAEADEVVVVFGNSNIHPEEEYARRRDTLMAYADEIGATVVELPYDPAAWIETAAPHGRDRTARCRACYRLRLGQVATWAAANGFDALSTTLTVSPYQDAEIIAEEGERAARESGIAFIKRDFRERYPEATRRSRELGMYRQNYCGCSISEVEASEDRERRRAERAAAKAAKRAATGSVE